MNGTGEPARAAGPERQGCSQHARQERLLARQTARIAPAQASARMVGLVLGVLAGTPGQRGVFVWGFADWVDVVASYNRAFD